MTDASPQNVIEDLGDGLIMRSARREDADALADFCAKTFIHEESGTEAWWIANWIRDLVSKPHPTLNIDDVIVVEDVANNRIASTTTYLTQTWSYDGVEFEIGRPELVGTGADYRNRGLIRKQFDLMHRWVSERGHLVQVVLGIPSYYRQFGYEYALHAEGGRHTSIQSLPAWGDEEREFRLRDAVEEDVPFITETLRDSAQRSLVSPVFRENEIKYMTFDRTPRSAVCHKTAILCRSSDDGSGQPVGVLMYAMTIEIDLGIILRVEMSEPRFWREALPSLLKEFRELADKATNDNPDPERAIKTVRQDIQPDHPAYVFDNGALGSPPDRQYAWYLRVPDVAAFLRLISPVLERRVSGSLHAGFTGKIELRLDRDRVNIAFERGKVAGVEHASAVHREANSPGGWTATARFPAQTFLPVMFGMRSVGETLAAHSDANTGSVADRHLIETLFPKRSSDLALTLT